MDPDALRRTSLDVWRRMAPGWERRHAFFEDAAAPVTITPVPEDERSAVRAAVAERFAPYEGAGGLELPALPVVATAA